MMKFVLFACIAAVSVFGRIERDLPLPRSVFPLNKEPNPSLQNSNKPINTAKRPGGSGSPIGINYKIGAPVMTGIVNIYNIYYGDWNNAAASWNPNGAGKSLIEDFASNIGTSTWYNTNRLYYFQTSSTGTKTFVSSNVIFKGGKVDNYSLGISKLSLSDADILQIVRNHITDFNGGVPDPNGLYYVLTSPDVTASSGFCTNYCGWHTYTSISPVFVKYSFVGVPPSGCGCFGQTAGSPNQVVAVDAMLSVYAHELVEAVTDPQLNAWYDNTGYENADKCAVCLVILIYSGNGVLTYIPEHLQRDTTTKSLDLKST